MVAAVLVGATLAALGNLSYGYSPTTTVFHCPYWSSTGHETFPVELNRNAYYKCDSNGNYKVEYCPKGKVYSEEDYECVKYVKTDLDEFQCPRQIDYRGYLLFPVAGDSRAVWKCWDNGRQEKGYCRRGYVYSTESFDCVPYELDHDYFRCPYTGATNKGLITYPVYGDERAYWQCGDHGYDVYGKKIYCPDDWVYIHEHYTCLPRDFNNYRCPVKAWRPNKYHYYPAAWTSEAYWQCGMNGPILRYCLRDHSFSKREGRCIKNDK